MRIVAVGMVTAVASVTAAGASTVPAPRLVGADLAAMRTAEAYGLRAVVRLSRAPTAQQRRRLGLLAAAGVGPAQVADGAALPAQLYGGTSLGRIGRASRHCYVGEVAQLRAHRSVRLGTPWRLVLHDGDRVLDAGRRVTLRRQTGDEAAPARTLGCF